MDILHRSFGSAVRAANASKRECDVVASSADIDAYGEILDQSSWSLDRYRANPIVLLGHNSYALPVGHASNVRVEDEQLRATLHFVTAAANPLAEQVWQGIVQGSLRAVSVGFRAKKSRVEKRGDRDVTILSGLELLEISVVAVPANPHATVEAVRSIPEAKMQKQWFQLSTSERIEKWRSDEAGARRMMGIAPTWRGKTYHQLSASEEAELYRAEPQTWRAMREFERESA